MQTKNKHSILIVADAFGKPSYAPRLRCLCDYLVQHDWNVEVYTEQFAPLDFEHTYPIYECPLYRNNTWDWILKTAHTLLTDWKNRAFTRWLIKATQDKHYDVVFCTTFSTFPLPAALAIARHKQLPLHVDLRDIDEQAPNSQYQAHRQCWAKPFRKLYRDINIRRRNRVIRAAQSVTTVSPWHVDFLHPLNKNITLVYNGFDSKVFYPQDKPSKQFTIAYVGRIYEPNMQDPTLLMQALQTLDIDLHVCWYTNAEGQQRIRQLALQYGVERLMEYNDYVPLNQVPDILHNASILLVLSNNAATSGAHGIMTTKFFEALGVEKPVLCVRSDEECLAQVIKETNAGLAATNVEQVKEFISDKYAEWKTNSFTRQPVNQEAKKRFTRQYQSEQIEHLIYD